MNRPTACISLVSFLLLALGAPQTSWAEEHAESRKVQAKSVELFDRLAEAVSPTYRETFETMAQFAELHRDIIDQFGRFPHRNKLLNRENTPEEEEYLAGDSPDFGQSG